MVIRHPVHVRGRASSHVSERAPRGRPSVAPDVSSPLRPTVPSHRGTRDQHPCDHASTHGPGVAHHGLPVRRALRSSAGATTGSRQRLVSHGDQRRARRGERGGRRSVSGISPSSGSGGGGGIWSACTHGAPLMTGQPRTQAGGADDVRACSRRLCSSAQEHVRPIHSEVDALGLSSLPGAPILQPRASMARVSGSVCPRCEPRTLPTAPARSTRSVAQVSEPMAVRASSTVRSQAQVMHHVPRSRRGSVGRAQAATATATDSTTTSHAPSMDAPPLSDGAGSDAATCPLHRAHLQRQPAEVSPSDGTPARVAILLDGRRPGRGSAHSRPTPAPMSNATVAAWSSPSRIPVMSMSVIPSRWLP